MEEEESLRDIVGPGWFIVWGIILVLYAALWIWLAIDELRRSREERRRIKAMLDAAWLRMEQETKDRMP
jgi:hypothetical protein